jgi:signal transduction histidine kinase
VKASSSSRPSRWISALPCQQEAAAARIELRVDAPELTGTWDRARVAQIVRALVANAIRHSGGAAVNVRVRPLDAGSVEIVVHDSGAGIPEPARAHLFDCFDRASPHRAGGLGVGLWVVKSLCTAMAGTVELDGSARGARFCVTLPRG